MKIATRNPRKLRKNRAIYDRYDEIVIAEKMINTVMPEAVSLHELARRSDITGVLAEVVDVATRFCRMFSSDRLSLIRGAVASGVRPIIGHPKEKSRFIMNEMSNQLRSKMMRRHGVVVNWSPDGIAHMTWQKGSSSKSLNNNARKHIVLHLPLISTANAMKEKGDFLSPLEALAMSDRYPASYCVGASDLHMVENDQLGVVRMGFVSFFRTNKEIEHGLQCQWMCQTKGKRPLVGLGDDPLKAQKECVRAAAKTVRDKIREGEK